MSAPPKRKRQVCHVCGCTDGRACPGGCGWTDATHTLCTACAEPRCVNCGAYAIDRIGAERAKTVRELVAACGFIPTESEATHGRLSEAGLTKQRWKCPLCLGKAVA